MTVDSLAGPPVVIVGAKKMPESEILAELMGQVLERHAAVEVRRRFNLGGTQIALAALTSGAIDLYAEYTGTVLRNILADEAPVTTSAETMARTVAPLEERQRAVWLAPFGFSNTYALAMRRDTARALNISTISDLARQPLRYGLSHEFRRRSDGLSGLQQLYSLKVASVAGMEHDLAYAALIADKTDVTDAYTTDAKILAHDLILLKDDRNFFPPYEAAPLVRADLARRFPLAISALALLAGRIDERAMRALNHRVEMERASSAQVAASYLKKLGLRETTPPAEKRSTGFFALFWQRRWITLQLAGWHLVLTLIAVFGAAALGIPLGIIASRRPRVAMATLGSAGILQTIPSIALLALMLPVFGVGAQPAIFALFLYGLLPIVRNTITGLRAVDGRLVEVSTGLGMRPRQRLWHVELPIAAPMVLAGIRTSMVINIGTATLAAFIGAGGLGEPIVTGLSVTDTSLVLCGAIPAAALALIVDALLSLVERQLTPLGLRLEGA